MDIVDRVHMVEAHDHESGNRAAVFRLPNGRLQVFFKRTAVWQACQIIEIRLPAQILLMFAAVVDNPDGTLRMGGSAAFVGIPAAGVFNPERRSIVIGYRMKQVHTLIGNRCTGLIWLDCREDNAEAGLLALRGQHRFKTATLEMSGFIFRQSDQAGKIPAPFDPVGADIPDIECLPRSCHNGFRCFVQLGQCVGNTVC